MWCLGLFLAHDHFNGHGQIDEEMQKDKWLLAGLNMSRE